jgi:hypothetical protein
MIDFGGWASNWEWSGYTYGETPAWSTWVLAIPAIFGLACVALSLGGVDSVRVSWLAAALSAAGLIEAFARGGLDDKRLLLTSYALSAIFAGVFALISLRMSNEALRLEFASAAPSLVFGFGPITSRAFGATLFSVRMVDFAKKQVALTRATLAGEAHARVVRTERSEGDDVLLTATGEAAGEALVASRGVLKTRHSPSTGTHFLLEAPSYGDTEASGYRGQSARRRVLAAEWVHFLGQRPEAVSPSYYWDEVRAGILFIVLEHAILFGIAWLVAHSLR